MTYCSNCGTQNENQAKFCSSCGKELSVHQNVTPSQPISIAPQSKLQSNKKLLLFGVPAITIILIIATVLIVSQQNKVTYTKNNDFLGDWQCIDMNTGNVFADLIGNAVTSYTDATMKFSSDGKVRAEFLDTATGDTTYTLSKDGKSATFSIDNTVFTAQLQGNTITVTAEGDDATSMTFEKN